MAKINQKEFEVLKSLGDEWKWIARDSKVDNVGNLFAYLEKTFKRYDVGEWDWDWDCGRGIRSIDNHLFQFIQWEDSEPYNIQELIEEYEEESEETEVKKDIEWLNNEVEKRIKKIRTDEVSFAGSDFFDEGYIHGMKDVQAIANQLDEPEVLSPDWIRDNVEYAYYMTPRGTYSSAKAVIDPGKLQNLLVPTLSEMEKVQLSQKMADELNRYKELGYSLKDLLVIAGSKQAQEKLARAWLDGFTVEENPKCYALIKGHEKIGSDDKYWNYCITDEGLDIGDNKVHADVLAEYVLSATKDEWENIGINEDNADFVEVEELEE